MNDLVTNLSSSNICVTSNVLTKLFADDIKLARVVNHVHDREYLQNALDIVSEWCKNWQLPVNPEKCTVLHMGKKSLYSLYKINDIVIQSSSTVRDLGITIDTALSFVPHIDNIVTKARQRSSLFFRRFACRDSAFLKLVYTVFIRPLLEYGSVIWSPTSVTIRGKIESVQKMFLKRILPENTLTYSTRLHALNLHSLEHRRDRFDQIFLYNLMSGTVKLDLSNYLTRYTAPIKTRGHSNKLLKTKFCLISTKKHFI